MSSRIPRQSPSTSSVQSAGQNLFNQLLEIGAKLLETDPELYKTAVAHLRDNAPRDASPAHRAAGAEQKGVQGERPRRSSTSFHKYNLPGDAGKREYYQCMICNDRRVTNSFHADHQHDGQKLSIRWYCPLCDTLYAVTHRGYHIKNRHKSPGNSKKGSDAVKPEEGSSEIELEDEEESPRARKRPRDDDDNTSQGSEDASASLLAGFRPLSQSPAPATPTVPAPADQIISTEGSQIVHTVTQECLNGGGTSNASDMQYSSIMPTQSSDKLVSCAVLATLSRA